MNKRCDETERKDVLVKGDFLFSIEEARKRS
jgi:hypothetical protein